MKANDFSDFIIHDAMAHISGITSKRMFGGYGLYCDGVIFGIISGGELYFRINEESLLDFKSRTSHPFSYIKQGKETFLKNYWLVPEEVFENPQLLETWVLRAKEASKNRRR